jgi:hypothetical protein
MNSNQGSRFKTYPFIIEHILRGKGLTISLLCQVKCVFTHRRRDLA